jgi:hypothetical protein
MEFKIPTETVELPSKGLLYPEGHPLASGTIEMKYMTAKEEDILSNQNYIKKGTVIEKLLQSLIVTEVDFNDILIGDIDAIMVAARVLSYGKDYKFTYLGQTVEVDLATLDNKELDESLYTRGENEFTFKLPNSGNEITFRLLTQGLDKAIAREIEGLKKINKDNVAEVSTRLKYMITSINGSRDRADIRKYVDGFMLASDARALREEYSKVSPGVDLSAEVEGLDGEQEVVDIPIGVTFFWPDA